METWPRPGTRDSAPSLETSLVEWKLGPGDFPAPEHDALGNFLSGMETAVLPAGRNDDSSLGNFLSGMETCWLHSPLCPASSALGNFLSGMETRGSEAAPACLVHLGNFLSGMETLPVVGGAIPGGRPWKLP